MNALKCRTLAELHESVYKCKLIGWWVFFQSPSDLLKTGNFLQNFTDSLRNTHYDDRQSPKNKASKIKS